LVRDQKNLPQYFICAAEDVTDRVRADRARQDSERRLTLAESAAHVGVWECDLRTKVITNSAEFSRLRGLAPDARPLRYEEWLEFVHSDDRERVLERMRESVKKKEGWDTEFRVMWPDGSVHWLLSKGTVFAGDNGEALGLAGVNLDITERKEAEAALRESEERFRNLADTVPVIIFQNDDAGNATFFNRQAIEFTGRALEQLVGSGWLEAIYPDDLEGIMASQRASLETPVLGQRELRLRRSDGQYRWMLVTSSPRFVGTQFTGYVGTIVDITDLKRTHGELLAAQKLESLGVLAGGIAHDFNNLLGSIAANSELVLSELSGSSPAYDEVESIRNVAGRAAEIVSQMMAYAGQEDTVFEPVDLPGLIKEMLELLKVSISKRATLNVALPEKLPAIRANAAQLRQVVLNLITNASEALGEQEGVISIAATQVQSDPSGSAPNLPRGDYIRLEISDSGCGMTEEVQFKIFDPFFTTKFSGRGMGLAAVKGIVRSHDGAINVVSAPRQGSRFEILLPCSSESAREGHDEAASAAGEAANFTGTILVVEDEDALRIAVSKILKRKGLTVIQAANGKTAIDLFRAGSAEIDVVLLDLTLPGMSGREVLTELRRVKPNVKVIITSAYSQEQAETALGGQHPWLYIRKPYRLNELTGLVSAKGTQSKL